MKTPATSRWPVQVLALTMATGMFALSGCGGGSSAHETDGGMTDPPKTAALRFVNASPGPGAGSLDIYLQGQTTPILSSVDYGATSAQVQVPVGTHQLDIRQAGALVTRAPIYTSDPLTVSADGSITVVGAGVLPVDPTMPAVPSNAFRVIVLPDTFPAAAPGKTRVRVVNTMYSLAAVSVDIGDDGSLDVASLARFAASDPAGTEVTAGSELAVGVLNMDTSHTRVGSFAVPGASLHDGGGAYVILTGLSTFTPRDARGAAVVAVPAPGQGAPVSVRPNPVVYLLAASADAGSIDGYIDSSKLFGSLAFGKLGQSTVRATASGYMVAFRIAGTDPGSSPLASLSTGPLDAGQQYLAVLTGAADALQLHVYRDDIATTNDAVRIRVVQAAVGAGTVDAGRYAQDGTWVDVADFAAIAPTSASPGVGTAMPSGGAAPPIVIGARLSSDPSSALRFAPAVSALPQLSNQDRLYAVLAGAWSPAGNQLPARYIIVRTAAINPWSTAILTPIPTAIDVAPNPRSLTVGGTQQYSATAVFGNGARQVVTDTVSWSSLDPAIARLSASTRGLVTALALGSTTVTASLDIEDGNPVTGTAVLDVVNTPTVLATQPVEGATVLASTAITVSFSRAMAPATIVAQTATGACTGTVQLSGDDFATCVGFTAAAPVMDATNTIATFQPAATLATQATYKLRVRGAVTSTDNVPMGADFAQTTGFGATCAGNLVISQIYGGGSANGGVFRNDFIELHNNGGLPVDVSGYVLQSSLATSASWSVQALVSGIIPPGGYYLIQEGGGGSMTQPPLPTPDFNDPDFPLNLNGLNGKVALTRSATAFANTCPLTSTPSIPMIDFVGYGNANCFEGASATTVLSNATAAIRNAGGCGDTNVNSADFTVAAPTPRNSASPVHVCACPQ